jgi:hypothetical protein
MTCKRSLILKKEQDLHDRKRHDAQDNFDKAAREYCNIESAPKNRYLVKYILPIMPLAILHILSSLLSQKSRRIRSSQSMIKGPCAIILWLEIGFKFYLRKSLINV